MSDIPVWVRAGAKVICVDDTNVTGFGDEIAPRVGEIYTIREIVPGPSQCHVRLVEIINRPRMYTEGLIEFCFKASRFKPLISQADDLAAHFNALLDAPLNHEREEA